MGIDPGVLYWTLGSGASACHAEPTPLFAMKVARALAGRPIRALVGVLGLKSGFEPPDLDRPGRLPHQQGLCEASHSLGSGEKGLRNPF